MNDTNKPSPHYNNNEFVDKPITLIGALAMNMGASYATAFSAVHASNHQDCSRLAFTHPPAVCHENLMAILNEALQLTLNEDLSLFTPREYGLNEEVFQ
jgi:hypothetical protein